MNIKSLAVAAVLGALPVAASAITLNPANNIADGGTYDLSGGPFNWDADFSDGDSGGSVSFTFNNDLSNVAETEAAGTVLQFIGDFAGGVSASWSGGDSDSVASGTSGMFYVATNIAFGGSDSLMISWGDVTGNADIDFAVKTSVIPVPAGVILLGTALAGLGFARRSKQRA